MPRKPNIALAVSVLASLTLGVGAYHSVEARPASPHASSATTSRSCSAPKYRSHKALLGVTLSSASAFGKVPVVRTWDTHGALQDSWGEQTRSLAKNTAMVLSFRNYTPQQVLSGNDDSQIRGFFKNAPRNRTIFWNYYHEPETAVEAHQFTPAQYRRAFRHIAQIAATFCRSNLIPTLVLMGWTADPRSGASVGGDWRTWKDFYPGRKYVSVVAWDPYNSATHVPRSYGKPRDLYHRTVVASRSVGKRWAIAETGSALVAGDSGSGRAAWLHKVARYSRKHVAAFVTYFNSPGKVNDFRLTDAASKNAWQQEMNR